MKITLDTTVVVAPDQLSSDVAGEAVVLNKTDGRYYGLDPVGTRIWSLMASPIGVGRIRDTLVREFEVEAGECEADLLHLLEELEERGLVLILPAPSPLD